MDNDKKTSELLNEKFSDLKTIKEEVKEETSKIKRKLKKLLSKKKDASSESIEEDLTPIASFLEKFEYVVEGLTSKLGSLAGQIDAIQKALKNVAEGMDEIE